MNLVLLTFTDEIFTGAGLSAATSSAKACWGSDIAVPRVVKARMAASSAAPTFFRILNVSVILQLLSISCDDPIIQQKLIDLVI